MSRQARPGVAVVVLIVASAAAIILGVAWVAFLIIRAWAMR